MALSCITRNVFLILPLLVILTVAPLSSSFSPSDKVTKELLDKFCTPTTDYKFCVWQTSYATTIGLDLSGLVDMVLQKTQLFGNKTQSSIKDLATTTTDSYLKDIYEACVINYELAVTAIEGAQQFARSKSYMLVPQAVSKALDIISWCNAGFKDLKTVPDYITLLNSLFEKMCNIGSIFSNIMML